MKEIKEKKRLYDGAKKISTVFDRLHALNKEIEHLRQKSDEAHRKIQEKASASQEHHNELIDASKEINALRAQEKEALATCTALKQQFKEKNDQFKQKIAELDKLRGQLEGVREEHRMVTRRQQEITLREKQRMVEDKMKRGGKLTTEDLLVMQGMD